MAVPLESFRYKSYDYNEASAPGPVPAPRGWPSIEAFRPDEGITLPTVIRQVKPQYTRLAMLAGIQGAVLIEGVVRTDGTFGEGITRPTLDQTFGLDREAIEAMKLWEFVPGIRMGEPVPVIVTVELTFTLR